MQPVDPHFPNLPFVSDEEWATWTKEQKHKRHTLEVAEAVKIFGALQAVGMDIFEAAERVPTPRMNRKSARQNDLRRLYQDAQDTQYTRRADPEGGIRRRGDVLLGGLNKPHIAEISAIHKGSRAPSRTRSAHMHDNKIDTTAASRTEPEAISNRRARLGVGRRVVGRVGQIIPTHVPPCAGSMPT
jgi:hypothetical protein